MGYRVGSVIDALRVEPGTAAQIADRDPASMLGLESKQAAKPPFHDVLERLGVLQQRLYAEESRSVLLVLQGLDASGKDGVINRLAPGLSLSGCRVSAFKAPTVTELAHDYLWRIRAELPARGQIGIFNRSHYEDIVAVRVRKLASDEVWQRRAGHIREFERQLTDEGTTIVKVFLHVSKDEQRARLQERVEDPEKRWKFRRGDLDDRARWDDFIAAYEQALTETSTAWAPWYVVPADRNWVKALATGRLLVDALERLDPQLPEPEPGIDSLVVT